MPKGPQVFISHATTPDGPFAHRLAADLRRLGVAVWIAPESIRAGESWVKAIERGLRESSHMLVVITPAALQSTWVDKETEIGITRERKGHMRIIPLDVEPCEVPLLLSSYQMVSFRRDYDDGLRRLAAVLGLKVASVRQPFEPEMVLIPAGEFFMGSDPARDEMAQDDEQPQHRLYLPEFAIARTPVTVAQFGAFVAATGYAKRNPDGDAAERAQHPVVTVFWHDAVAYCCWLAEATGRAYRLPTEAEWEKGARGTDGRIFPWGDEPPDQSRCNFSMNIGGTTPVGRYPRGASPYGLLDMLGNVWEWTSSLYRPYPYQSDDGREDPNSQEPRVLRGGAFYYVEGVVRCACRNRSSPLYWYWSRGFRVVASPI